MEKCKSINVYVKNGKAFAVVTTAKGDSISINFNLLKYAIEHPRPVKVKEVK